MRRCRRQHDQRHEHVCQTPVPLHCIQPIMPRHAARPPTSPHPRVAGWNSWSWRGHNVNWLAAGDSGPVVLLIHGAWDGAAALEAAAESKLRAAAWLAALPHYHCVLCMFMESSVPRTRRLACAPLSNKRLAAVGITVPRHCPPSRCRIRCLCLPLALQRARAVQELPRVRPRLPGCGAACCCHAVAMLSRRCAAAVMRWTAWVRRPCCDHPLLGRQCAAACMRWTACVRVGLSLAHCQLV